MKHKKLFIIIFLTLIVFSALPVQATEGRSLNTAFPEIRLPDGKNYSPQTESTSVPKYIAYIYYFLIMISGLLALGILITGGLGYIISSGSPEKMKDAKDKIFAALLGMLILFGSWILLYNINPELVSFNLPELRPIITELTPGILLCKDYADVTQAWDKTLEFNDRNTTDERKRELKEQLDKIYKEISFNCYTVISSGDIRGDMDNKVKFIYAIPRLFFNKEAGEWWYEEYGAIIYNESGYKGASFPVVSHLIDPSAAATTYGLEIPIKDYEWINPSSIKPFKLDYSPDVNGKVTLYSDHNLSGSSFNYAADDNFNLDRSVFPDNPDLSLATYWSEFDLDTPPLSMKIEGDVLATLITEDYRSETFEQSIYNNLEDYVNIVDTVACKEYDSKEKYETTVYEGSSFGGGFVKKQMCHKPAAVRLFLISGKTY